MTPSSDRNSSGLGWLRFFLFFFVAFTLFMTAGLPLIMHYAGGEWKMTTPDQSATAAFVWLGVGCFLWILVLVLFTNYFILSQFRKKRLLERLLQNGRHARGTIVQKQALQAGGKGELLALKVAFRNLVDAEVETTVDMVDSEPSQNRFAPGKTVSLLLDPEMGDPAVMIQGKGFQWNRTVMTVIVLVLLILLALAPGLLIYSYIQESRGYGWRYLGFGHPFVLIPFIIGMELLVYTIIRKLSGAKRKASKLLLYGKSATATIISTAQTGLYINEQPQVRFTIEFEGSRGRMHQASFKQVIDLLRIPDIAPGKTIPILYDPEHPEHIQPLD